MASWRFYLGRGIARIFPEIFWDALFPRFCVACSREGALLCQTCQASWAPRPIEENILADRDVYGIWSVLPYADPVARQLITAWKYRYDTSSWEILRRKLAPSFSTFGLTLGLRHIEAIVPLPLSRKRRCERGFDQADEIAKWLSRLTGVPTRPLLVRRHRDGHQAERSVDERQKAMLASPFAVPLTPNIPRRVLLVDDVWTTGATMDAGARTLKLAGVEEVHGFSLAKGS